jgi:hypothetical protein
MESGIRTGLPYASYRIVSVGKEVRENRERSQRVIFAFTTLAVAAVLITGFLVLANRHANDVIKKRSFERVAQGTRPYLRIVPPDKNTAGATLTSANVANSWPSEPAQAASFGTSGRVQ